MKSGKTRPTLRLRFLRGNKYNFIRCGANLLSYTLVDIYLCHDEPPLSLTRPRIRPSSLATTPPLLVIINTAVVGVGHCRRLPSM